MTTQYIGNIHNPVQIGHIFVIGGKTIDGASTLDVSLQGAKHFGCKIPLHLSVRFHEKVIVRNAFDNNWLQEERHENLTTTNANPILAGENFRIYILVGDLCFHISINGYPYCTFMLRLPLEDIRTILIDKDLQLITQVDHRTAFPIPYPIIQSEPDQSIVFSNDVPKRFSPGHIIIITAIPSGNNKGRFTIVFYENGTQKQALHYNVRFNPDNVTICNSMNDNLQFGKEERDGKFPFSLEQEFKLVIGMTKTKFKFAVNGKNVNTFDYRRKHQLDYLNGFKVQTNFGLFLEITSVEHLNTGDSKCKGHVVIITATPLGSPYGRFIISFRENGTRKEIFHFNPRFDERVIVRNSMDDNLLFMEEERLGSFPFQVGEQFKIVFGLTAAGVKFAINGLYNGSFTFRSPNLLQMLNGFQILSSTGLSVVVSAVDHYNMGDPECTDFEVYSDLNAQTY